jgi:hypothetical protein
MLLSGSSRLVAGVALIHERDLDRVTGDLLDLFGQFGDLGSVLLVGRNNQQCEQLSQGVNGPVHLRTFAALVPIITRTSAAFRCRLKCSAIENHHTRLLHPVIDLPHQHAQVVNHLLEHASFHSALRLLLHGMPWRQVVRHHAPLHAGAHDISQAVEHLAQRVFPLRRVFAHQS